MLREKHEEPVIHGEEEKVFRPEPVEKRYRIRCEEKGDGRIFHIESSELERLYVAPGGGASELKKQIMFQLKRMGALGELEKIGIEKGDIVKCGDITWYW
jgi:hypothetical protein